MYFIKIHKDTKNSGYETHLVSSDNLVDWKNVYAHKSSVIKHNGAHHSDTVVIHFSFFFKQILFMGFQNTFSDVARAINLSPLSLTAQ